MPPKSPLPPRHGLEAAWVRTPDRDAGNPLPWPTMRDFLIAKLAPVKDRVDDMLDRGCFVDEHGRPWTGQEAYRAHTFVWFHRELRDEPVVPGTLDVLYRDDRIVVFDKPHFLSTIPRGRHVTQSAVVRGRQALALPELSAAHRLDRGTAGVLLMTTKRQYRAAYHQVFNTSTTQKTYEAIAPLDETLTTRRTVSSHIVKRVGTMQAETLDLPPNAQTTIRLLEARERWGRYEARPTTGKTHQIRMHFSQLQIPLLNDPLYPEVLDVDVDDFSHPMALLARELRFIDPFDGTERVIRSQRSLAWADSALSDVAGCEA